MKGKASHDSDIIARGPLTLDSQQARDVGVFALAVLYADLHHGLQLAERRRQLLHQAPLQLLGLACDVSTVRTQLEIQASHAIQLPGYMFVTKIMFVKFSFMCG